MYANLGELGEDGGGAALPVRLLQLFAPLEEVYLSVLHPPNYYAL